MHFLSFCLCDEKLVSRSPFLFLRVGDSIDAVPYLERRTSEMSSSPPESTDLNNSTLNDFMIHRFVDPFLL